MSLENKYFAELARRLRAAGITAGHPEKNRLTVLLNNQPVLSVSAGSDVFLLPAGSNQPEAGELYHKVAQTADEVYAYLTILGMLKGENEYTYPPYGEAQARELIDCLREIAPYVVIDCGSYIANDILSAVALMEADSVLRLANADLKSISYLSSQLPLLKDAKWDTDKQYKIAANVKPQQAGEQIGQALGNVAFILPHSEELEAQFLAGILLSDLTMKESRSFRKEIEQVCREVFSC